MIGDELHKLVAASHGSLSINAGVALLLALWSASRGMSGMITAFNIAYQDKETRGFFKRNFVAIGLTVLMLIGGAVTIALVGVLPAAIQIVGLDRSAQWLLLVARPPGTTLAVGLPGTIVATILCRVIGRPRARCRDKAGTGSWC